MMFTRSLARYGGRCSVQNRTVFTIVENVKQAVKEALTESLQGVNNSLRIGFNGVNKNLGKMQATMGNFEGYVTNTSKSLEQEVVVAAYEALKEHSHSPQEPWYDMAVAPLIAGIEKKRIVPDGFIGLGDGTYAIVEAASTVTKHKLNQVDEKVEKLRTIGYNVSLKFVGGPSFTKPLSDDAEKEEDDVRKEALKRGFSVVCVNGSRYTVDWPNDASPPAAGADGALPDGFVVPGLA